MDRVTTGMTPRCTASTRAWARLGVDSIDLLLLHQPLPSRFDLTLGAYRALEELYADGQVRAIEVLQLHDRRPARADRQN